jgi:hypothetical protein
MPTLIYVHGRGQKHTPQEEHDKWYDSLLTGMQRLAPQMVPAIPGDRLELAYWSDLFYPPQAQGARARGVAAAAVAADDENPQGLSGDDAALVDRIAQQYWASQLPLRVAPPPLRASTRDLQPSIAPARGLRRDAAVQGTGAIPASSDEVLAAQYEDSFMRDVVKYFALGFADKVRVPLVDLLTNLPLDDGTMLVSHSFGTIICYDVLIRSLDAINKERTRNQKAPLQIDTWVTMGCPLGWALDIQSRLPLWLQQAVAQTDELKVKAEKAVERMQKWLDDMKKRLLPSGQMRAFDGRVVQLGIKQFPPQGVDRWYNIYDPRDPVAYPPVVARLGGGAVTVGDTFLSAGAQRAFDVYIVNDFRSADIQLIDPEAHSDRGYGECAQLAQLVRDFWVRWDAAAVSGAARAAGAHG